MIEIWQVGNTGVRNPMRIQEAFRLYAESNLVGKLRGVSGAVAFTNYLCEKGILNNAPGKDPTGSYGRKWRLVFNKNGFTYDVAKGGLPQADNFYLVICPFFPVISMVCGHKKSQNLCTNLLHTVYVNVTIVPRAIMVYPSVSK